MPLVSILIAVHNRSEYLRQLLHSLIRSNLGDFEAVVIDDASEEDIRAIMGAFSDPRIRLVRLEQRMGPWAAFNRGIRETTGEWLCALGSDDVIAPDYLSRMANAAMTSNEIDYLYPESFRIIDANGIPTGEIRRFLDFSGDKRRIIPAFILHYASGPVPHAGAWIRRSVFREHGLYNELPNVQDTVYMAHFSQDIRFAGVFTDSGYQYRVHADNTSLNNPADRHRSMAAAMRWMLENLPRDVLVTPNQAHIDEKGFREYITQTMEAHSANNGDPAYREALQAWLNPTAAVAPKRRRIAVMADQNNRNFLRDFLPYLESRHEVRVLDANRTADIEIATTWAEATWVEWTERLARDLSLRPRQGRLVCRLHSYEAYLPTLNEIRWNNVDAIVFSSPQIKTFVESKTPGIAQTKSFYVSEGVNLEKFAFKPRTHGPEMLFVGNLTQTKNVAMLLQLFRAFMDRVPNARLHIVGEFVADAGTAAEIPHRYMTHIISEMGVTDRVRFYRKLPHEQLLELLQNANYLISTSFREGLPFSILEGMATGIMPMIHNWPGAKECFPADFVFNYIGEIDKILRLPYDSAMIRRFIEEGHNHAVSLPRMEKILTEGE
jgi:glycosyltransferase involved in cell wall biosynthesis